MSTTFIDCMLAKSLGVDVPFWRLDNDREFDLSIILLPSLAQVAFFRGLPLLGFSELLFKCLLSALIDFFLLLGEDDGDDFATKCLVCLVSIELEAGEIRRCKMVKIDRCVLAACMIRTKRWNLTPRLLVPGILSSLRRFGVNYLYIMCCILDWFLAKMIITQSFENDDYDTLKLKDWITKQLIVWAADGCYNEWNSFCNNCINSGNSNWLHIA